MFDLAWLYVVVVVVVSLVSFPRKVHPGIFQRISCQVLFLVERRDGAETRRRMGSRSSSEVSTKGLLAQLLVTGRRDSLHLGRTSTLDPTIEKRACGYGSLASARHATHHLESRSHHGRRARY
jgi:hypothetical protein